MISEQDSIKLEKINAPKRIEVVQKIPIQLLQEVTEDVCDNFCEYRDTTDEEDVCDWRRQGNKCPLDEIDSDWRRRRDKIDSHRRRQEMTQKKGKRRSIFNWIVKYLYEIWDA